MITITLDNTGKRFGSDWVFRRVNFQFSAGKAYAILGPNGSGKSTLLQLISGYQTPTEGTVRFSNGTETIDAEDIFNKISLCAPYMQLIEEFTLLEQLRFHFSFKKRMEGFTEAAFIDLLGMQAHASKQMRHFSSGMKQRVKLCLAILSDVPAVLLDEPATNLDEQGVEWYKRLLENYISGRLLIISSNRNEEHEFCNERIQLADYKRAGG